MIRQPFRKGKYRVFKRNDTKDSGFSLIEIAVAIVIIGIFSSFALVSFERTYEDRDARALETAMASYQNVVIQGSQRLNVIPADVSPAMAIQAVPPLRRLAFRSSGSTVYAYALSKPTQSLALARSVAFRTNRCGDVCATRLNGFTYFALKPSTNTCPADRTEPQCRYIAPN
jgi:prepilin-type N-terminal cleavage/methylation domain-containing protein